MTEELTKVIFIAGPIGNGGHNLDPRKMYKNIRNAEAIMEELMKRGWAVICPHVNYHAWINWNENMDYKRFIAADKALLAKADAVYYMTPEKYGPSVGAKNELKQAQKLGIPIFEDLAAVPIRELET